MELGDSVFVRYRGDDHSARVACRFVEQVFHVARVGLDHDVMERAFGRAAEPIFFFAGMCS